MCRDQFCVATTGAFRPNVPTFHLSRQHDADTLATFSAKYQAPPPHCCLASATAVKLLRCRHRRCCHRCCQTAATATAATKLPLPPQPSCRSHCAAAALMLPLTPHSFQAAVYAAKLAATAALLPPPRYHCLHHCCTAANVTTAPSCYPSAAAAAAAKLPPWSPCCRSCHCTVKPSCCRASATTTATSLLLPYCR